MKKVWKEEEAVSPVIGVILMVAITVVLAAVLYVWASSFVGAGTKVTPKCELTVTNIENNYQCRVQGISEKKAVQDITWEITDAAGQTVATGGLEEIYGILDDDQYNPNWQITFWDNDFDAKVTDQDVIVVRGHDNPLADPAYQKAIAKEGYKLQLKFDPTDELIVETTLVS